VRISQHLGYTGQSSEIAQFPVSFKSDQICRSFNQNLHVVLTEIVTNEVTDLSGSFASPLKIRASKWTGIPFSRVKILFSREEDAQSSPPG
jgi:hypothetical protein